MTYSMQEMYTPGVLEVSAREARPVSMLISDDLPTFERPIIANSGSLGGGHWVSFTALPTYSAVFTFVWEAFGSSTLRVSAGQLLLRLGTIFPDAKCMTALQKV